MNKLNPQPLEKRYTVVIQTPPVLPKPDKVSIRITADGMFLRILALAVLAAAGATVVLHLIG